MNIAICDDETEYREHLKELITFYFTDKHIEFSCFDFSNGEELLKSDTRFDIVLLDVEMDGINGIKTAKEINRHNKNTVIFIITAYQKYLDEAMDLNVFRYIDKPINAERLYAGLDKAMEYSSHNHIVIKTHDNGFVKISKSNIVFIEVSFKKVYVVTTTQKHLTSYTLEHFKELLTDSFFIIPHNSYIVNMNYITQLKREQITLTTGDLISIAPKKQASIKHKFIRFIGEDNGSLSDDF